MPEWILASASPRRRDILSRLGLQFCTDPSRIPEPSPGPRETPSRYVLRMARMKAEAAGGKYASGMVIGADTAVALDAKVTLDGNALFRHPGSADFGDKGAADPQEQMAAERGLTYVKLDGDIGILGNGAGLVMVAQAGRIGDPRP